MSELRSVMEILKEMVNAEKAVSDFYAACASAFPAKKDLWHEISVEELNHAESLTQSDVAKVLGISYQSCQRLEKPGKSNPTLKHLRDWQGFLTRNYIWISHRMKPGSGSECNAKV